MPDDLRPHDARDACLIKCRYSARIGYEAGGKHHETLMHVWAGTYESALYVAQQALETRYVSGYLIDLPDAWDCVTDRRCFDREEYEAVERFRSQYRRERAEATRGTAA